MVMLLEPLNAWIVARTLLAPLGKLQLEEIDFDLRSTVEDTLEIPVQVNGKLRDVMRVPANADNAALEAAAKASEKVQPFLAGKTIKKVIVVPKKLVNIAAA